jgi:hypothetical protein
MYPRRLSGLKRGQEARIALGREQDHRKCGLGSEPPLHRAPGACRLLIEQGLDISITGFEPVEIDQIVIDLEGDSADPADDVRLLLRRQRGPVERYRLDEA